MGAECLAAVDQPVIQPSTPGSGPARWLELVPAVAWSDQVPPWREPPSDSVPFAIGGWQLYAIPHASELQVQLGRRDFGLLAGGVLFLCCLAGSGWLSRHHLLLLGALLVGIAASAIVLPAPLGEFGPFAWWGTVGGLLFRFSARGRRRPPQEATVIRSPDSRRLPARALLTAGLLLTITTPQARAAAPVDTTTNDRSPLYDVYLPTDDPDSDDLYLPRSFRVRLLEESDRRQGRLAPWVLQSADYRGTFTRRSPTRTALETLTAEYEIIVPELNLPLRLPLAPETVAALEREARLDGRPVVLQWLAESSVLIVPISQPGPHRLQLTYRPPARTEETGTVLELPIPPAPRARLTLISPDRSGPVEVATAYGVVQASESTGQIQAELGPTRQLVIRWNPPVRSDIPAVEQSSWLRLSPDQVRLDVRFRVDARRWPAESILIEADERLQFDTAGGAQPLSIGPGREDGDRLLQFALLVDEADLAMLELNFVLAGSSGAGRLRLPRCRVLDQPDVSHWLGVSADPRLVVRNESAREAEPRPVLEFADRWGDESVPELAFRLQDMVTPWTCSTTLREPTTRAEIQTAYEIFRQATRVIGVANLTTQAGDLFQQQWEVPAGTQWQKVTLVQRGETRAVRWVSDRDGSVRVFFNQPVSGSYQLVFVGEQMTSELGPRTLSRFRLLDVDATTQQLFVFRGSDVMLSSLMSTRPSETTPQLATAVANQLESSGVRRSREHAAIRLSAEHPDPVIEVRKNEPEMEAELVHVVTRHQNEWYLQLEVRLALKQGILDGLWLEVPEPWIATLQNDSQRIVYGGQSPRPGVARMIVWPAEPWRAGAPVGFSIDRIPIPVTPGAPLTVPNVRLLKQVQIQRYLYLPIEVDSQPVLWDTAGLEPERAGPEWASKVAQQPEYRCFRIRDDSFQAVRLPGRSTAGTPRVHLADLHLVWDTDERYHGLALLDLQPGGVSQCQLQFPAGMRPLRVDVEDTPVVLTSTTDRGTVRLELMSDELPQRISVLYEGGPRADVAAVSSPAWAPTLQTVPTEADDTAQEIEVLQTLWTVSFCDQLADVVRPASVSSDLQESAVDDHERLRLRHLSSTFERAQRMTTDFSRAELGRWYSHWGERFQATLHRARQLARKGTGPDSALQAELAVQQQAHAASVAKLEVLDAYQRLRSRPDPLDQLSVWQQAQRRAFSLPPMDSLRMGACAADAVATDQRTSAVAVLAGGGTGCDDRMGIDLGRQPRRIRRFSLAARVGSLGRDCLVALAAAQRLRLVADRRQLAAVGAATAAHAVGLRLKKERKEGVGDDVRLMPAGSLEALGRGGGRLRNEVRRDCAHRCPSGRRQRRAPATGGGWVARALAVGRSLAARRHIPSGKISPCCFAAEGPGGTADLSLRHPAGRSNSPAAGNGRDARQHVSDVARRTSRGAVFCRAERIPVPGGSGLSAGCAGSIAKTVGRDLRGDSVVRSGWQRQDDHGLCLPAGTRESDRRGAEHGLAGRPDRDGRRGSGAVAGQSAGRLHARLGTQIAAASGSGSDSRRRNP